MATLICTIEMDKEKGLTLKVEDPDGKSSQTVTIDGKAITLEVKNNSDTSTIVQKPDSVTITCKNFNVDAETLRLRSKKDSEWRSGAELKLESSKDMSLTSNAKLTQKAGAGATLSSNANIQLKASAKLELEGQLSQLEAKSELKLEGAILKMSGTAQAELAAPLIKVAATTHLGLESSGLTELKGTTTNVSGAPVNLG